MNYNGPSLDIGNWTIKNPFSSLPELPTQAELMVSNITRQIIEFEKTIDESQEVGFRLISTPDHSTIHIERVECQGGFLLVFVGRNDNGREVRVLQHTSHK
jgi:hypothetical protein